MIELVRKKCIDVLAIQEHGRRKTAVVTDINIPTGYRLFMNDTHSPGVGGIGFVISPRCSYELISSEFFSTRIGKLVFDVSRRRIHILYIYAPTAIGAHTNETMSFYDRLSSIVDTIPTRDHLFLCGDFNTTLPVNKVCVKNRCGEANCNTKMLQSFIERHDLLAANAYTRQKHRSLPTIDGPNGRKTRLDWIFCPLRYRCNLQKSNIPRTYVIASDHRFVTASFSLKWPVRKSHSRQIDWTSLITPDICSAFVTDVRQEIDSGSDVRLAVLQASVRHLPSQRHSSYSRLQDDPRILNARNTVQGACSRNGQASTEHIVSLINLDEVYTRCADEFAQNTIDDIEKHTLECRSAEAWKAINLFCGRKFRFMNCVNSEFIDNMELGIRDHYAAVVNQAPSDYLVKKILIRLC